MAFDRDLDGAYAGKRLFSAGSLCCFCFLPSADILTDRAVTSTDFSFTSNVFDTPESSDDDRVVVNPAHGFKDCDASASCLRRLSCTWLRMADRSPALLLDKTRDVCVLFTKRSEPSITSYVSDVGLSVIPSFGPH